jgi:hypothetical protein
MKVAQSLSRNKLLQFPLPATAKSTHAPRMLPSLTPDGVGRAPVGTNEVIRADIRRLSNLGVSQKTFAARMGLHESWFSRWLNQRGNPLVLSVAAMDGYIRYLQELAATIGIAHQHATQIDTTVTPPDQSSHRKTRRRRR